MWKKELIKNKIYAVILMCIGALVIPWCDGDATFFLFSLMMGIPLFFAKENWIYEGEENDGTSREETYSEIRTKSENHHIQSHKRAAQYSGIGQRPTPSVFRDLLNWFWNITNAGKMVNWIWIS